MGLLQQFTGSSQRRRLEEGNRQAIGYLNQGYDDALRYGRQQYGLAQGYLQQYGDDGRRASNMYQNAMGLNGLAGGQLAQEAYGYARNPYLNYEQDQAQAGLDRMANARGGLNSGMNALAAARARMGLGYQDNRDWRDRLAQQAAQGGQYAGMQSQLASGFGNQLMGLYSGRGQQMAANAQQFANAMAASEGVLPNLLTTLGGYAMQAYGASQGRMPQGGAGGRQA